MTREFSRHKPIYKQIMEHICQDIVRGVYVCGNKLPSVRELAIEVGVNANTIQRVYQELERDEIVVSKRGQGTFITEDEERINVLKEEMKKEIVQRFITDMMKMGFTYDEMLTTIKEEAKNGDSSESSL
ncbi:GntR family transcriptional regulator [Cerasibacillus quisquiliarum]|uniref:GntR family transcriptional regulator n=1 Tax=Cerasibacillus quisquiliarum TaxID=227865 RepID=A0A511V0I7_9BACI|nr:GntR family transcriptional regulator [Cerasibacillus quisquiliarum]MBB5147537.1 GntR family transcriptional regulator [Cerasibacillus quisquiliarum]GEN32416.1 GntR family transcriptional regulator [Cerasibacillus quisquiliarum]